MPAVQPFDPSELGWCLLDFADHGTLPEFTSLAGRFGAGWTPARCDELTIMLVGIELALRAATGRPGVGMGHGALVKLQGTPNDQDARHQVRLASDHHQLIVGQIRRARRGQNAVGLVEA